MEDNTMPLARLSFEGRNYSDAYLKYSTILEGDINNIEAMIGRGLSAGFLSTFENNRLKECLLCLDKVSIADLGTSQKINIATSILDITQSHILNCIEYADKQLEIVRKEPMASMELQMTRKIKIDTALYSANNKIYHSVSEALDFGLKFKKYNDTSGNYSKYLSILDNYLRVVDGKLHSDTIQVLTSRRNSLITEIKSMDSTFSVPEQPSSGCFIATAIYCDYSHPKVMTLRNYRDSVLTKSIAGKMFISLYYKNSPPIARFLVKNRIPAELVKLLILEPIICGIKAFGELSKKSSD